MMLSYKIVMKPFSRMSLSRPNEEATRVASGPSELGRRRSLLATVATALCMLCAAAPEAQAQQTFPSRPVVMVVPFSAGGPTDIVARTLGAAMEKSLGQSVIIDNKPGAGGTIGVADVARATPDGYRILIHHIGMATAPTLYRKLAFNVEKDFEPIGLINDVPMMLVARVDAPEKDLPSVIERLKKDAGKMTIANAGVGSASHLCGLMLMSDIDTQVTTVPYKGAAPALTDLIGGQVDLLCDQSTNTWPHLEAKKIKAYAVTTPQQLNIMKETPTMSEAGLPGFNVSVWHALYAPKRTPNEVVEKLNNSLLEALKDPNVLRKFDELGAVVVEESRRGPNVLKTHLHSEIERWAPIIRKAGVYAD